MMSKTNRRVLEFQADRIEAVLARHKVSARVTGGMVSPRWIQFQVLPALGTRVAKVRGLAEELALSLDTDTCRVARQGNLMTIEIPRADPSIVSLMSMEENLADRPFLSAVLGLADDGAPLLVRLPSPQVSHLLIAGTTGSGKSALAKTIIASLARRWSPERVGFLLVDPKLRAFKHFGLLPHLLTPVLSEGQEVKDALDRLVRLMIKRDQEGVMPDSGEGGEPRVVVVIDELVDLLMSEPEAEKPLTRLVQRGREAGIHVIACTQKPSAAVIGSLVKANFPVRLVGQVTSPEDAKVATGYAGTGADRLTGKGDFMAVTGGQVTRFQAAYIGSRELWAEVTNISQSQSSSPVGLPELPEPHDDDPHDDLLSERVELARPVWSQIYDGESGKYEWGGKGKIAAAIFGDGDTSTAGHRGRAVTKVCTMLEQEKRPKKA